MLTIRHESTVMTVAALQTNHGTTDGAKDSAPQHRGDVTRKGALKQRSLRKHMLQT